jgi:hypothetical protein
VARYEAIGEFNGGRRRGQSVNCEPDFCSAQRHFDLPEIVVRAGSLPDPGRVDLSRWLDDCASSFPPRMHARCRTKGDGQGGSNSRTAPIGLSPLAGRHLPCHGHLRDWRDAARGRRHADLRRGRTAVTQGDGSTDRRSHAFCGRRVRGRARSRMGSGTRVASAQPLWRGRPGARPVARPGGTPRDEPGVAAAVQQAGTSGEVALAGGRARARLRA